MTIESPTVAHRAAEVPPKLGGLLPALAFALPSAGGAYAAWQLRAVFDAMSRYQSPFGNAHGGAATVGAGIAWVNRPALIAFAVAALAALVAFVVARRTGRSPTAWATTAVLGLSSTIPGALLWRAESAVLDALRGTGVTSVAEATTRMQSLTLAAIAVGVVVGSGGLLVAFAARRASQRVTASPPAWALAATLFGALATAFAWRAVTLHSGL